MRWQPGPRNRGCIYHRRGVHALGHENVVADVFVMPRIAQRRPIAITVGRYRDFTAVSKREWQLESALRITGAAATLRRLFEELGLPPALATNLGNDVEQEIVRERVPLQEALASLTSAVPLASVEPDDIIEF